MVDGIDFDNIDKYTYENRDQQRYGLPHRIIFRIYYDQVESMRQQRHLYHLLPMIEINNGEVSSQPLKPYHRQFYRQAMEEFNKQFRGVDWTRLFTPEELSVVSSFKDKLEERDRGIRPGFPEDITFAEEQMIYNIIMNVSKTDVLKLLGIEEVKVDNRSEKDKKIDALESQVGELTALIKQLLDKKE